MYLYIYIKKHVYGIRIFLFLGEQAGEKQKQRKKNKIIKFITYYTVNWKELNGNENGNDGKIYKTTTREKIKYQK